MARINFRQLSTAQFEALTVKDSNTQYEVFDEGDTEGKIYLGDVLMSGGGSQPTNETVQIAFTTSSGTVDWTQYTVGVQVQGQAVQQKAIDASGNCQFTVTLGSTYKIICPKIYNYAYIDDATYIAVLSLRVLNIQYQSLDGQIRSVVLERSNPADWATSGNESVVDNILSLGSYVIDDVHKKYAKLDPLNGSKFVDGTAWSGTYGDAFRHLPTVYYKMTTNEGNEPVLQISGYNLGEGSHSWGDSWIGTYKGSVDNYGRLRSIPNVSTTQNKTMTEFFNAAQAHTEGADYGLVNYFDQCKIMALMYAKYGNANSETIMGGGLQSVGSSYYNHTTGTTAALGDATGSMQYFNTQFFMCKLFGIEDLAGSTWEFRPNIRFTSSQCIVYEGNVVSNIAQGRAFVRTLNNINEFTKQMILGEFCDFLPKTINGSSTTYYCDNSWATPSGETMRVGGDVDNGSKDGISANLCTAVFDAVSPASGARLAFKGDISQYELVDGATLAQLNS